MKGYFKDINNEAYTVEFNVYPNKVITLGDDPVEITQESEGLFTNIKTKGATVKLITDEKLPLLYNNKADEVSVTITNNTTGITAFNGFVTPNIYSQSWLGMDELEVECVDGISVLQHYDYSRIHDKGLATFNEILCNIFKRCKIYKHYYLASSILFRSNFFMNDLSLDEDNFIDDDDEKKPWKCLDALEEILKFFNLSLVVYNNEIYLLDYEYINAGYDDYFKIDIDTGLHTLVKLSDNYTISKKSHKDTDVNLSLDETFNQISISCNTYPYDDVFIDLYDNIHRENHMTLSDKWAVHDMYYYTVKNPWIQYYYSEDDLSVSTPLNYGNDTLFNMYGALITKRLVYEIGKTPSRKSHENVVIMRNQQTKNVKVPYLWFQSNQSELYDPGDPFQTSYLCISGQVMFAAAKRFILNDPNDSWTEITNNPTVEEGGYKNVFRLIIQIGDKYWNTETNKWQNTPVVTYIPVGNKDQHILDEWVPFTNTITYNMNINESEGFAIPIKSSDHLYGPLNITIYNPVCPEVHKEHFGSVWYSKYSGLKNFKVDYVKVDPSLVDIDYKEEDKEKDIVYKNIIDTEFVNEFEDIELKVNTQTELENSQSSVIYDNGLGYTYLKSLTNVVNNTDQIQEQNIIQSWVHHYNTPKNILELTIEDKLKPYTIVKENNLNCNFLVDTISSNLANASSTVKLIEF